MNVDAAIITQVIELRRTGLTLQQIGERFGKADSFAFKIIKEHAPDLRRVKVVDPTKPPRVAPVKRSEMVLPLGTLERRCFMGDLTLTYDADDPDEALATRGKMRVHIETTPGHDRDVAHRPTVKSGGARRKKGGH